jgi:hypothetical protein
VANEKEYLEDLEFRKKFANGMPLRQMRLASSLPPDVFVGTQSGNTMLAFVGSKVDHPNCMFSI